jgi:hypothetical protein
MRVVRTAVAALTVVLALPAAAHAHAVAPNVDCSAATLVYESTAGTTLSHEIVVNGVPAVEGSFVIPSSPTSGTLTVPYSAPAGPFTVTVNARFSTGERGTVTKSLTCVAPPPPPPAVPPAASPPAPPVNVTTPGPPPASAVAGEQVPRPASARLAAQSACRARVVRVTVAGRRMRTIAFSVNGRHVRTVTVRPGQRSVKVSLPIRNERASQVVRARVRFRNGARPRTLSARTARCAQAAVQPTFTG